MSDVVVEESYQADICFQALVLACAGYLGHLFIKIGDLRHTIDLPSCIAFTKRCSCQKIENGQASVQ